MPMASHGNFVLEPEGKKRSQANAPQHPRLYGMLVSTK
jgi:hypothetical protein